MKMPQKRETLVAVHRTEGASMEAERPAKKVVIGRTVLNSLKLELEKISIISFHIFCIFSLSSSVKDDNINRFYK